MNCASEDDGDAEECRYFAKSAENKTLCETEPAIHDVGALLSQTT